MTVRRLADESAEYTKQRAELVEAEIALMRQREHVAEMRRSLPAGPIVENYVFHEGASDLADTQTTHEVRLSELFREGGDALVLIHFMYGGANTTPCPMCSMWADAYDAAARHLRQRTDLAVVAEADVHDLRAWARTRGWRNLRLLSSAGTPFKSDLKMQDENGAQSPGISIFTRDPSGHVRHHYTAEAVMSKDAMRGVDLLSPVYNMFDLLPKGRGDFFPSLEYDD